MSNLFFDTEYQPNPTGERVQFIEKLTQGPAGPRGAQGPVGPQGPAGSGGGEWGAITGTLSSQTDLQQALTDATPDSIQFNTAAVETINVGKMFWNDADGTIDLGLKGGNVTLQIGQEEVLRVVNKSGGDLLEADFAAVRIRSVSEGGSQGGRLAVVKAKADSDANSATTIGLVTETIPNNQEGFVTISGKVSKINTTGAKSFGGLETWVDGDVLYLDPVNAGYLTKVKPQAPEHTIIVGWIAYAHANNGRIFVKVDNGYEIDELHNVKITSPTDGDVLIYDGTQNVWKNVPLSSLLS